MLSTAGDNVNVDIDSLILANPSNDDDAERLTSHFEGWPATRFPARFRSFREEKKLIFGHHN